jgi:hypothetical protein
MKHSRDSRNAYFTIATAEIMPFGMTIWAVHIHLHQFDGLHAAGPPFERFLHALESHSSQLLRSLHCAFAHLLALFSNEPRLPTDEIALNLEQFLRTPGLNDLKREVEAVGASVRNNNRPQPRLVAQHHQKHREPS